MKFSSIRMFFGAAKNKAKESTPKDTSRQMKFPYTYTAKIAQFPLNFHFKNNWMWKYYVYGFIVSIPIFFKIHRLSNSKENVEKWRIIKEKEKAAH